MSFVNIQISIIIPDLWIILTVCEKGYYRDSLNNECKPCPIGTYSDIVNIESCITCPEGFTTIQEGSTVQLQCYTGRTFYF